MVRWGAPWLLLAACGPGRGDDTSDPGASRLELPVSTMDLVVQLFPDGNGGATIFDRFATAFGVHVLASRAVPESKLLHATRVLARYLDNDENGAADAMAVVDAMRARGAAVVMFGDEAEVEVSGFLAFDVDGLHLQDLYVFETAQPGRFDAALEEVLHLVSDAGYAPTWPDAFGTGPGTRLSDAMDVARGGHFEQVPDRYPDGAWYHYRDPTCSYRCMATEYLYWAMTSRMGSQAARCGEIAAEWELCTPESVAEVDIAVSALLDDPSFALPTVAPDGSYGL